MDQVVATAEQRALALGFDPAAVVRITAEMFEKMAHAGLFSYPCDRVELREGMLCRMNAQYVPHGVAKADVYDSLRDALRDLGLSLRAVPEISVRVSDHDVPEPDVVVWEPVRTRGPVPVERVRLVAEICDTTQDEDLGRKPKLYATAGIPEYWIVDLPGRIVHRRWAPADGAYARSDTVPFGDPVASATIPGLAVATTALRDGQNFPE